MKESVANAESKDQKEKGTEAGPRTAGSRIRQDCGPKQLDLHKRAAPYDHAINEFVAWYRSEPRLAFNRTHLEQQKYASATINLRLAAVRRVAYEAGDSGLPSPELAAGIRRVKGVRRIVVRLGNWLTVEQGKRLLACPSDPSLREKRNHAMIAMLIGCGFRRGELLSLDLESIQLREDHWVVADLIGKRVTFERCKSRSG